MILVYDCLLKISLEIYNAMFMFRTFKTLRVDNYTLENQRAEVPEIEICLTLSGKGPG